MVVDFLDQQCGIAAARAGSAVATLQAGCGKILRFVNRVAI